MPKKLIAIDIDDVLSYTAEGWVAYTNKTWGMNLTADDYEEDWLKVWNVPLAVGLKRRDIMFGSGIHGAFVPNNDAKSILKKLEPQYRLIIVTSRVEQAKLETINWLDTHFSGVFESIKFSGFYDKDFRDNVYHDSVNLTKSDILKDLGADYLIDDQLKHCTAAANAGVSALLFGDYKWNRSKTLPKDVFRVKDWKEVARHFNVKG